MNHLIQLLEPKIELLKLAFVTTSTSLISMFMGWSADQLLFIFAATLSTEIKEWVPIIVAAISGLVWAYFTALYKYQRVRGEKLENDRRERENELLAYKAKKKMVEEIMNENKSKNHETL